MTRLSVVAEYLKVNQKWLLDGVEKGAQTMVIVHDDFFNEYWPQYYQKGDPVPVHHQILGGRKYVYMIIDLTNITPDDTPTATTA